MADGLDLGTLTVKLAADVDALKKDLAVATAAVEKTGSDFERFGRMAFGAFEGIGGAAAKVAGDVGRLREGVAKIFGDGATAIGQEWGRAIADVLGLSGAEVEGLAQAVRGLEGAFMIAAVAANAMLTPLGAALAAVLATVAGYGALKMAMRQSETVRDLSDPEKAKEARWASASMEPYASDALEGLVARAELLAAQLAEMDQRPPATETAFARASIAAELRTIMGTVPRSALSPAAAMALDASAESKPSAESSSSAGSAIKEYLIDPMKASLASATEGLGPMMSELMAGIKAAFAPGEKKSEIEAARKKADDDALKAMRAAEAAKAKSAKAALDEQARIAKAAADEQARIAKDTSDVVEASMRYGAEIEREIADAKAKALQAEQQRLADEEQARSESWAALAGGKFGSALKVGGIGGTVLDILGSALGSREYAGAAMQGAAAGGQSGGPWGALIGAIVALVAKTETFGKILDYVDGNLRDIVPVLSKALSPLAALTESVSDLVGVVMSVVGVIADMSTSFMSVVDAFTKGIGAVASATSDWVAKAANSSVIDIISGDRLFDAAAEWIASWGQKADDAIQVFADSVISASQDAVAQLRLQEGARRYTSAARHSESDARSITSARDRIESAHWSQQFGERHGDLLYSADHAERDASAAAAMQALEFERLYAATHAQTLEAQAFAESLAGLQRSTRDAGTQLDFLRSTSGESVSREEYFARRELSEYQQILGEKWDAEWDLVHGTRSAADALAIFSDAVLNAAPGFKIAAAQYAATTPAGVGTTINVYGAGAQDIARLVRDDLARDSQRGAAGRIRALPAVPVFVGG